MRVIVELKSPVWTVEAAYRAASGGTVASIKPVRADGRGSWGPAGGKVLIGETAMGGTHKRFGLPRVPMPADPTTVFSGRRARGWT
jgi:hypothetical protein